MESTRQAVNFSFTPPLFESSPPPQGRHKQTERYITCTLALISLEICFEDIKWRQYLQFTEVSSRRFGFQHAHKHFQKHALWASPVLWNKWQFVSCCLAFLWPKSRWFERTAAFLFLFLFPSSLKRSPAIHAICPTLLLKIKGQWVRMFCYCNEKLQNYIDSGCLARAFRQKAGEPRGEGVLSSPIHRPLKDKSVPRGLLSNVSMPRYLCVSLGLSSHRK